MVTHMKTTVEILDPLLEEARQGSWERIRDLIYEGRGG